MGHLEMCLGHEGGALMNEISVLKNEVPQSSLTPSTMWADTEKEPAMNRGKDPHQNATMQAPRT